MHTIDVLAEVVTRNRLFCEGASLKLVSWQDVPGMIQNPRHYYDLPIVPGEDVRATVSAFWEKERRNILGWDFGFCSCVSMPSGEIFHKLRRSSFPERPAMLP